MRSIVVLLTYCNTLKNHKDGGILAKLDLRLMDSKSSGKRERWKILQEHSRHHKRKGVLRQGHEILSFSSGGNRHRPTTPQHTVSGWDLEAIWARGGMSFLSAVSTNTRSRLDALGRKRTGEEIWDDGATCEHDEMDKAMDFLTCGHIEMDKDKANGLSLRLSLMSTTEGSF